MTVFLNGQDNDAVPAIDSAANALSRDVIGNKSDTVGGDSLVSLMKSAGGSGSSHAILYTGVIYYVDAGQADDTGDGLTPTTAKKTIGAALALMAAGDRVVVKAGAYNENGLDMNLAGMEMLCEANAIIVNAAGGTVLTISGAGCVVYGAHAVQAGQVGFAVTGIGTILERCIAVNCTIGFDIDEHSTQLFNCVSAGHTVTGFDIGERNTVLRDCYAAGTGTATRGFYISAAACTRCLVDECHSVGNGTAGFEAVASSHHNALTVCTSGGGDGARVDNGTLNTWPYYQFDDVVNKDTTFAGATTEYNIFQVTGAVRLRGLIGHVETAIPATASTLYIELYSTGGTADITDSPGPNIQDLVAGAILVRNADSTNQIDIGDPDGTPVVVENTNFRDPATAIDIVADDTNTTYIRLVLSAALASGKIHWHAHWEPLTEKGFLEAVA